MMKLNDAKRKQCRIVQNSKLKNWPPFNSWKQFRI